MINKIIKLSIENKFIVGLFVTALIGVGIYSMMTLNLGSVPDITNNQVQVMTVSENLATEDIEQFVTYPVELAMGNLPGVKEVWSISRFGLSIVTVVFEDGMGKYLPRQLVQEKLNEVKEKIPEKFGSPKMGPITTGLGEIYQYTIDPKPGFGDKYSLQELRTIQDWIVKRQMTMIDGVIEVSSWGGYIKQYEIAIDPDKLNSLNISISEVFDALENNNVNTGGAYIEKGKMANFIRGEGLVRSLDDIKSIVIKNVNGIPVTIGDAAEKVHFGSQVRYGALTIDGREGVGGMVLMLKDANPNSVIKNVKERIEKVQESLPEGLEINPFLDRSKLIERTTDTVTTNLMEGALIVIFVLVLLLGSLRGGLITASVIPLSLLFAFILMKITGVWANLMSLGAIDFGIIVDGAVIIVEGTVHEIEKRVKKGKYNFTKEKMNKIAYDAGSTMMNSAFLGQLIILIVFTPILFLTGIEGKMFRPMAFTFGFAVLGAIILCLTYVPMAAALVMKPTKNKNSIFSKIESGIQSISDKLIHYLFKAYSPLLKIALKFRILVISIALLLLIGTGYIFNQMGGEFIPQLDEGDIAMHLLLRPGSSLSETIEATKKAEKILLEELPEVEKSVAKIGVADIPTDPMPMDLADLFLILEKDKSKWTSASTNEELIEKIKEIIDRRMTGVNLIFSQPVQMRFNELLTGVRQDIAVKLYGEDMQILDEKINEMAEMISSIKGVDDVSPERTSGLPQITVRYNRDKIAQYGLNIEKLNTYVSTAFAGGVAGVIFEGERRFDMVVRFDEAHRKSIDDLKDMYIDLNNDSQIPLKEVADISYRPGPMQISRDNTFRRTYVGVNTRDRDIESVVNDIQEKINAELELPPGYHIRYEGEFENLQQAKNRLSIVVPIALFLIFILLYFALKSFSQSVMIYMAIPLAAIGGVLFLTIRGMPFSISAGVGFVVLFGVAVLNGLVLISRLNSLKEEGVMNLNERIKIGTKERLRPILLTATAAIMGFTPMAFSTSPGAEVQRPLATVVIGGLISATFLTLIIVPVLYHLLESRKNKMKTISEQNNLSSWGIFIAIGIASIMTMSVNAQDIETEKLQTITLDEAVEKAIENYPELKSAEFEIEKSEAMKLSAWDLGTTSIYTGREEVGNGSDGINNVIGIQQQKIDIFNIPYKMSLYNEKVELSKSKYNLTKQQLITKVKSAWSNVFTAKKIYGIYKELDSAFSGVNRAAEIKMETEDISKLEYLSTLNKVNEISIQKEEAYRDYLSSLSKLNLWLSEENKYTVAATNYEKLMKSMDTNDISIEKHPMLRYSQQKINVAEANVDRSTSDFFPEFFGEYGVQEINDQSGFYKFQIGVSIPLIFTKELSNVESAEIENKIAEQEFEQKKFEFRSQLQSTYNEYFKWLNSWNYYESKALPLAEEQRKGALTSYRAGDITYIEFLHNISDAIRIELNSWEAFNKYLSARFNLEYFLTQTEQ